MSLNDKILEIFKKQDSLSSKDVTEILREEYKIVKSFRTVERHIKELNKHEKLLLDPKIKDLRKPTFSLAEDVFRVLQEKKLGKTIEETLEFLEQKLGKQRDLRLLAESLRTTRGISPKEADITKIELDLIFNRKIMEMNEDEYDVETQNLFEALKTHFGLLVDSAVKTGKQR